MNDVPEPGPPGHGEVVVRPEAVGNCGSDIHLFTGELAALSGARHFYPRIQGHSCGAFVEPESVAVHAVRRGGLRLPGASGADAPGRRLTD